jgi:hypothetical protein
MSVRDRVLAPRPFLVTPDPLLGWRIRRSARTAEVITVEEMVARNVFASAMCWLILVLAQPAEKAQKQLQGTWTATTAERDGKAADPRYDFRHPQP